MLRLIAMAPPTQEDSDPNLRRISRPIDDDQTDLMDAPLRSSTSTPLPFTLEEDSMSQPTTKPPNALPVYDPPPPPPPPTKLIALSALAIILALVAVLVLR